MGKPAYELPVLEGDILDTDLIICALPKDYANIHAYKITALQLKEKILEGVCNISIIQLTYTTMSINKNVYVGLSVINSSFVAIDLDLN